MFYIDSFVGNVYCSFVTLFGLLGGSRNEES